MSAGPPRLAMRGIRKAYRGVIALDGVDFAAWPGEVHALLGENGAGKSTLMRVLAGEETADAGSVDLAPGCTLAMIHQDLALCPDLTVAQNIELGREQARSGIADRARAVLAGLGHADISPAQQVGRLGPAERQIVEIARAIASAANLVIMDEPTSSLGPDETSRLFATVRAQADRGTTFVLISHSFREVRAVAGRFTVLRDGRSVGCGELAAVGDDELLRLMAGRAVAAAAPRAPGSGRGEVALRHGALELRRGEILGIFGMCGAGRTELLRELFARDARRHCGLLAEDRKSEGLMLQRSVAENLTLPRLTPFARAGVLDLAARDAAVAAFAAELAIKCRGPGQRIAELSGGNQQKVAFARLLHQRAEVLLLDEPTRGIDVAGKRQIAALIQAQAAAGKAVLLVSSYLPELLALADKIAVMRKGVLAPAQPVSAWNETSLLAAAAGGAA